MAYKSPVYSVTAVPIEKIEPNTYNPNSIAPPELKLLYDSIKHDGYTMPVVCYYDSGRDKYILVDGFHRYRIMLDYPDIYEREQGMLPVSVIDKSMELHELGRSDAWISKHLGMDRDEILRLKQITGLTALFKDVQFGRAWRPAETEPEDERNDSDTGVKKEERQNVTSGNADDREE